jgi:hypothetical protein
VSCARCRGRREVPGEACESSQRGELRGLGLSRSLQRSVNWRSQRTHWLVSCYCEKEGILRCFTGGTAWWSQLECRWRYLWAQFDCGEAVTVFGRRVWREGVITEGELSMHYDKLLLGSRGCMQWTIDKASSRRLPPIRPPRHHSKLVRRLRLDPPYCR